MRRWWLPGSASTRWWVVAVGDAAAEQAAIAIASAGTRKAMDRFMTDDFPSGFGLDVVSGLADSRSVVFSTKSTLSTRDMHNAQSRSDPQALCVVTRCVVFKSSRGVVVAQLPVELILVRQLAHGLAVPTFVVDAAGDRVFVNEAAEALLGLDFEDVGQVSFADWTTAFASRTKGRQRADPATHPLAVAIRQTYAGTRTAADSPHTLSFAAALPSADPRPRRSGRPA